MAAFGGLDRRFHAGRPAADDDNLSSHWRPLETAWPPHQLAACRGAVYATHDARATDLVARDTGAYFFDAPIPCLVHPLPIGDERARHADDVCRPRSEHRLGQRRMIDALAGDHRQGRRFAYSCGMWNRGTDMNRHVLDVRTADADRDRQIIDVARLRESPGDLLSVGKVDSVDDVLAFVGAEAY